MPNKRTLGLVVILAVFLFSGLGFSCAVNSFIYTYNETTDLWVVKVGTWASNSVMFCWGECYDLDKLVTLMNENDAITSANITLPCNEAEADIKCETNGYISKGNGISRIAPRHFTLSSGNQYLNYSTLGLVWNTTDYTATDVRAGFTTNGTYYNQYSESGGGNACSRGYISIKNNSYIPYFNTLVTSGDSFETTTIHLNVSASQPYIYFYPNDLGVSNEAGLLSNSNWYYYYNPSQLSVNALGHAFYSERATTDDYTSKVSCQSTGVVYNTTSFFNINVPLGSYDIFCYNFTVADAYINGFTSGILEIINNTGNKFDAYFSRYGTAWASIFNVRNIPTNPMPNTSVTVAWTTVTPSDSILYWRMGAIGGGGYSSWVTQNISESVVEHSVVIGASNILENYIYQYYVQSGATVENNSESYYNFTVLGSGGYATGGGAGGSYMDNSTSHLAKAVGVSQILIINLFAILILAVALVGTIWFTSNPILTVAVFVVGVSMLTLFGFLPYYMFIIIAIIVALGMVKLIGGIIG